MMKFDEACKKVGYDRSQECPIPISNVYYAYKNGEVSKYACRTDAEKVSKLVERVDINKENRDNWYDARQLLESQAQALWLDSARDYWANEGISGDLFNVCYAEAYDRCHSSGYDEVANYMYSTTDFAKRVLNAATKDV